MANLNNSKNILYEKLTSTKIYNVTKMNLKQESFNQFYEEFNKTFQLGKFLGNGVYKVAFDDKTNSKKVIKIVCTKQNKISEAPSNTVNISKLTRPVDKLKLADNDYIADYIASFKKKSNSNNSKTENYYEYSKLLSEIKFMFANPDVGLKQSDIHIYANKENIERIKQNITNLQEYEKAFYDPKLFNNPTFIDKFSFVETDVSDLESIFVWREPKYIASLKDVLDFKKSNSKTNSSSNNYANSAYNSRTPSPLAINNGDNKLKKDAAVQFLIYLLEQINIVLEYPDDNTILIKKLAKTHTQKNNRKLMVNDLHSSNYGIFTTNNLNDNRNRTRNNKSTNTRKQKYTARITNASSCGIPISYSTIIYYLKRLLSDKTIIIQQSLLSYQF